MAFNSDDSMDLFRGLKALSDASFPKKCSFCGMEYATVEEYIQKTQEVSGKSGLKRGYDDDDKPIVELFRNCICGSTLMDCFEDRRDVSAEGVRRRELFEKLMGILTEKGIAQHVARNELIRIFRGEQSPILEKLGVNTQIR